MGGFDLAAQWMKWNNLFHCEIDSFCQSVLRYYWPDAELIQNIIGYDFTKYTGLIDILSGGWPCQKYSIAGSQIGEEPLKEEMLRVVSVISPTWIVLENVYNFIGNKFAHEHRALCERLENMGYQVQTFDIDAASCEVPTMERHIWIVAQTDKIRPQRSVEKKIQRQQGREGEFPRSDTRNGGMWELPESRVCELGEGIPAGLATETISKRKWHTESIKALGNAIPPQVAYEIFKAIDLCENVKIAQ